MRDKGINSVVKWARKSNSSDRGSFHVLESMYSSTRKDHTLDAGDFYVNVLIDEHYSTTAKGKGDYQNRVTASQLFY